MVSCKYPWELCYISIHVRFCEVCRRNQTKKSESEKKAAHGFFGTVDGIKSISSDIITVLLTPGAGPLRWPAAHSAQWRSELSSSYHLPRQQRCSCCPSQSSRCSCGSSRQPVLRGSAASRWASPAATNRWPCRCKRWWKAEEGFVSAVWFMPPKIVASGWSIKKVRLAAICLGFLTVRKTRVNYCSYSGE